MVVTLAGIVMLVTVDLDWKARVPMLVTGRPAMVPGMVTAPPAPV